MTSILQHTIHHKGQYRERRNIRELVKAYNDGNKKPLSDLLRAWKWIQELDPTERNSFFIIAGYHGEPFRGAGWGNPAWWGGYCNHGNVLFPTWHRAYLWRLENALRSAPGCENVTLPFWDETDADTTKNGLPPIFTAPTWVLDTGETICNPLYSYVFQEPVWDNLAFPPIVSDTPGENVYNPNPNYYKYPGYETVRYPFSGLTSEDPKMQAQIDAYNNNLKKQTPDELASDLNFNIINWLTDPNHGTHIKYEKCLEAPNYTVFSNTTSAAEWNERNLNVQSWGEKYSPRKTSPEAVVPLESPHNDMHLAVGGFNYPGLGNANTSDDKYALANGDMGENETASFDPVFFFHHCFVDKVFWDWQKKWGCTKHFDIIQGYPGTNSVDAQGPTPGVPGGTWLSMSSALAPFKKGDSGDPNAAALTSLDVIDIETQLGYTYIDTPPALRGGPALTSPLPATHHAVVHGVNRGAIGGSFMLATYKLDRASGARSLLGYESVLSRWHTAGCANCQTHLNVKTFVPLPGVSDDDLRDGSPVSIVPVLIPRLNKAGKMLVGGEEAPQPQLGIIRTAPPPANAAGSGASGA